MFTNGKVWLDTDGNPIHAHGGHMLRYGGYWYWYGEDRRENYYVSCYRSRDLSSWEFRNHVLTTDSQTAPIRVRTNLMLTNDEPLDIPPDALVPDGLKNAMHKVNLERPKVLYNEKTGKFVMWIHFENGRHYHCAAAAIATCDTPDGDFTYHGSFNPFGYMSRDCTLFKDTDGTAYFLSASRDNADMHVYRLTEDYMNTEALVHKLWQGEYREAPAVMRSDDGKYFIYSSYCTGWAPNQGKYAFSDGMESRFSMLSDFGDDTTFRSQPAFILPLETANGKQYIYVGDRWGGKDYMASSYIFLLIHFDENGMPYISWNDNFELDDRLGYREVE